MDFLAPHLAASASVSSAMPTQLATACGVGLLTLSCFFPPKTIASAAVAGIVSYHAVHDVASPATAACASAVVALGVLRHLSKQEEEDDEWNRRSSRPSSFISFTRKTTTADASVPSLDDTDRGETVASEDDDKDPQDPNQGEEEEETPTARTSIVKAVRTTLKWDKLRGFVIKPKKKPGRWSNLIRNLDEVKAEDLDAMDDDAVVEAVNNHDPKDRKDETLGAIEMDDLDFDGLDMQDDDDEVMERVNNM